MTGDVGGRPGSPLRPDTQPIEILHVDDDPGFVDLVATFLEREHDAFTVRTETDPRDALAVLEAEDCSVDCVVSDYDMPGLDGLTVLERVRDAHTDLPFILFTGKGSEEIASEAISRGVTDYLQKGSETEQFTVLSNRVVNAVRGYRSRRALTVFREAVEQAGHVIYWTDPHGVIQYVNPAFEETTGYSREEAVGATPRILKSGVHDDSFYAEMWETITAGETWESELVNRRKDGTLYVVHQTIAPLTNDRGDVVRFVAINAPRSAEPIAAQRTTASDVRLDGVGDVDP